MSSNRKITPSFSEKFDFIIGHLDILTKSDGFY